MHLARAGEREHRTGGVRPQQGEWLEVAMKSDCFVRFSNAFKITLVPNAENVLLISTNEKLLMYKK